jgi:hypothetical protein
MDLAGSSYLFTLATLSITFVGFSAILMMFRQTVGGDLSLFDSLVLRTFIQLGFIVTAGSMLPPLLALCGLTHHIVWRSASAIVAVAALLLAVTYPARRRAAAGARTPRRILVDLAALHGAVLVLLLDAAGVPAGPGAGLFAVGMTAMLAVAGIGYLHALEALYEQHRARR